MSRQSVLEQLASQTPVIAPSLLKCDFGNLHREMELLEAADARLLHLDVMDGHFVPNLTYGPVVVERLRALTAIPFDTHLMIDEPDRYLDDFLAAGCDCITFHIEAVPDPTALLGRIHEADAVAGLALNPETPIETVRPFLSDCDLVLVMSVNPGFGGQSFQPSALDKLRQLREWSVPQTLLSVDGGINRSTIHLAAAAGADVLVAGSAVFDASDYGVALCELAEVAENGPQGAAAWGSDQTVRSSLESN